MRKELKDFFSPLWLIERSERGKVMIAIKKLKGLIEKSDYSPVHILIRPNRTEMPLDLRTNPFAFLLAEVPDRGVYLCETMKQLQRIYDYAELYLVAGTLNVTWLRGQNLEGIEFTSIPMDEELPLIW
ncbi:MAG TPA: hypothetical protein VEP90_07255 [Methylomirabilota bacterium]|nr:hypothetical protein [Methylomirabilota bacterium]